MRLGSSKVEGSIVLGILIICSLLVVLVLNSTEQVAPLDQRTVKNDSGKADGLLVVLLYTNQDPSNPVSDPSTSLLFPVSGKSISVLNQTNPNRPPIRLVTNLFGIANYTLPPGPYIVKFDVETLHPAIPVQVTKENATILGVQVQGRLANATFSEFSDPGPAGAAGHATTFILIPSAAHVADLNDKLVVKVRGPGTEVQFVNASVVGERSSSDGLWLQMQMPRALDLPGSSGVSLTVYGYAYKLTVEPIATYLGAFANAG